MEVSGEVDPIKRQSNPESESSSSSESEVSGRNYSELKAEDPPAPSLSEVEDAITSAKESPPVDLEKTQQHQLCEEVKAEEGSRPHEEVEVAVPSSHSEAVKVQELTKHHEQGIETEPPKLYQEAEAAVPINSQIQTVEAYEPIAEVKTAVVAHPHEEVKAVKPQDVQPKLIVDAGNPLAGTSKPLLAEQPLQSVLPQQQANPSLTQPHYPVGKPEVQSAQVKSDPISVNKPVVKSEGSQAHVEVVTTPVASQPANKMEDQPPVRQSISSRVPEEGRTSCRKCKVF